MSSLAKGLGELASRRAGSWAEPGPEGIRKGIAALLRGEAIGETPPAGSDQPAGPDPGPADLLGIPGAEMLVAGEARVFCVRRLVDDLLPEGDLTGELAEGLAHLGHREPGELHQGLRPAIGCPLDRLVVIDLETTGFWGCPIFLVGLLLVDDEGSLVTLQLLARDYPEEPGILRAADHLLRGKELLVSFNGKSYDVPCFAERAAYHRLRSSIRGMRHVDVLHPARRAFRGKFVDCRLQTLEKHVADIWREDDVPSWAIPAVYHEFTATGRVSELLGVLHHGRVDLVTTARLLARLAADPPSCARPGRKRRRLEGPAGSRLVSSLPEGRLD